MQAPRLYALAFIAWALALLCGRAAWATDARAGPSLRDELTELAGQSRPGRLGINVTDLRTGRTWRVNAAESYPMMSVFKAPLGATVLSQVDSGRLSLNQTVVVRRQDLMTGAVSQIAATFQGDHETFTVRQLLVAAVSHSDNTAADVLLEQVGGPSVVTAFLRDHGIMGLRVDRGEEELAREFEQRNTLQPAPGPETPAQRDSRLRRGYEAYLRDPRDRSTPDAAALFLRRLWQGELLSPAATRQLLGLMYAQTIPSRLRTAIPDDVRFADRCGTSPTVDGRTAAFNDIGILTWPDGHTVIVAAFLTDAHAPEARMSDLFKTIAGSIVAHLGPGRPSRRPMR